MGAETQFTPIPAVAHLKVELGLAAEQGEVVLFYLNNTAIGPARHFLTIGAVTNNDPARICLGLEGNVTTVTAAMYGNTF
jgi:hypothetical protein